ncbi:ABC transporter permease [Spirulina sp. 06S082]|uniref:ABC transporter permease n=1 Tax=Spirulina sp. 06S082 TaxID=3110248 RepID=UPI002B200F52|nr:ABC transporter permease [Spirulina sp. 06S082]MEA5468836.1 ABC transporter permease [Spirulina sp. 06S082]
MRHSRILSNFLQRYSYTINVLLALAWKDIKLRYKKSLLGFFWSLLSPLIFLTIFILVFKKAFPELENYPLFVLTGIIYWNFFSTTTAQILISVTASARLLKSIAIPSVVYPAATALASAFNFLMSLIPFALLFVLLGGKFTYHLLFIFPVTVLFALFILGLSLVLTSLNVYFSDVGILWNSILPALLYFTPIAYPSSLIPPEYAGIVQLNPLYHYAIAIREVLYWNRIPSLELWLKISAIALLSFFLGYNVFRKLERYFISSI